MISNGIGGENRNQPARKKFLACKERKAARREINNNNKNQVQNREKTKKTRKEQRRPQERTRNPREEKYQRVY
jgi:hypothetical protein